MRGIFVLDSTTGNMARRFSLSRHHAVVYFFPAASDAGRMPRFPPGAMAADRHDTLSNRLPFFAGLNHPHSLMREYRISRKSITYVGVRRSRANGEERPCAFIERNRRIS